jgi:hypothetical protein
MAATTDVKVAALRTSEARAGIVGLIAPIARPTDTSITLLETVSARCLHESPLHHLYIGPYGMRVKVSNKGDKSSERASQGEWKLISQCSKNASNEPHSLAAAQRGTAHSTMARLPARSSPRCGAHHRHRLVQCSAPDRCSQVSAASPTPQGAQLFSARTVRSRPCRQHIAWREWHVACPIPCALHDRETKRLLVRSVHC